MRRGGHPSSSAAASSSSSSRGGRIGQSAAGSSRGPVVGGNSAIVVGGGASGSGAGGGAGAGASTSRNAASNVLGAGSIAAKQKDPTGRIVEWKSADDRCPVCKTDRYLNPNLRLLVGPCYHKMCESCIDRIFALGPAPCPVCRRTCRKNQFGFQTFEDLQVEREVALRRTIAKKCGGRTLQEDFDGDLKAYNDYLDEVETTTFNLIHGVDEERCWRWVNAQETAHRNAMLSSARAAERESELARGVEEMEHEERRRKGERLRALDAQMKHEREQEDRMLVEMLEQGQLDAEEMQRRRKAGQRRREKQREKQERAIEQEFAERAEDRLSELLALASSAAAKGGGAAGSRKGKGSGGDGAGADEAAAAAAYGPLGFRPEMLQDFVGPYAALDDGSSLLPSPLAYASTATTGSSTPGQTAADLLAATGVSSGGISSLSADQLTRMAAGGYSWEAALRRDHQAGLMTAGWPTPAVFY